MKLICFFINAFCLSQVSMVTVPPIIAGCPSVKMVELCPSTMTCIPGTCECGRPALWPHLSSPMRLSCSRLLSSFSTLPHWRQQWANIVECFSVDLVHLTCQSVGSALEDLSPVVTKMFHTGESHDQGNTHTHKATNSSLLSDVLCAVQSLLELLGLHNWNSYNVKKKKWNGIFKK